MKNTQLIQQGVNGIISEITWRNTKIFLKYISKKMMNFIFNLTLIPIVMHRLKMMWKNS